jgi:pimeloyl-ACP methyl ester carboxylesterase
MNAPAPPRSLATRVGRALLRLFAALALLVLAFVAYAWQPDLPLSPLRARWAPPPSQFVVVDGMQVHLRDEGVRDDPSPVVLLHGTSASLHTWEPWVRALTPHRRVITFDLPGFGLTGPSPRQDYSIEGYVQFVLHTLDRCGVRRFVLGGNSLGGAIAWETAVAAPARVERLILVDAGGYRTPPTSVPLGFRLASNRWLAPLAQRLLTRRLVRASVRNVYGDPSRVTDALVERYFQLTLREGNRAAVSARLRGMRRGEHEARVVEVTAPTLVLWGGRDQLIPIESARRFQRDIAGSTLVVFDDLGHVPQEEAPQRTIAPVQAFLGLSPQPRGSIAPTPVTAP